VGDAGGAGRKAFCAACGLRKEVPGNRAPYGWYLLSVQVPEWFNSGSERNYRWVGMFCSAACLAAYQPELDKQAALLSTVYQAGS
jgi:hypothetical protein